MNKTNARFIAVQLLNKWEKENTYINISLNHLLNNRKMTDHNRRFLTELVNGVVKMKLYLDWVIDSFSHFTLQIEVRNILRVALYQIIFMNGIPPFAAVNEAVNTAKRMKLFSSTRLINGILRGYLRNTDNVSFPASKIPYLSTFYSHPVELVERYLDRFGEEETINIFEVNNKPPPVVLRLNTLKISYDEMAKLLNEKGITFRNGSVVKEAFYFERLRDVRDFIDKGYLMPQDESSMIVSIVLSPKENSRVWDMCSAPGGKTTHIAQIMKNTGYILATDIYPQRVNMINDNLKKYGIENTETKTADAMDYEDKEGFDYILLDAPCSNTGVLRRKADARWKFSEERLKELTNMQKKLIDNAIKNLKDNGIFVYSTCSIEEEENEDIVDYIIEKYPFMKIDPISILSYNSEEEIFHIQKENGPDGGFVVRFKKEV